MGFGAVFGNSVYYSVYGLHLRRAFVRGRYLMYPCMYIQDGVRAFTRMP